MQILLAEDAVKLSKQIVKGLTQEGHRVEPVFNGEDAMAYVLNATYDIVVLDALLPGIDGFEVLRRMRKANNRTPVLMLTALDSMEDIVRGLDVGADDYLTKPFSFEILCARLRAVARRGPISQPSELRNGDLVFDLATRKVTRNSREIALTRIELTLLEVFLKRAGMVISRDELLRIGWTEEDEVKPNTLDVFIYTLRKKLTVPPEPEVIATSRGYGYYMRKDGES